MKINLSSVRIGTITSESVLVGQTKVLGLGFQPRPWTLVSQPRPPHQ